MAGDSASGTSRDSDLPEPVREWLARIAAERGVSEAELLRQLAPAVDSRPTDRVDGEVGDRLDALAAELDAADDRIDATETSVEAAHEEFEAKLEDVRERVVQIKRETDTKADAEHDHEDLAAELDALHDEFDAVVADLDDIGADLEALDERVSTGFENFRSVLEYLTDTTDELDVKFDHLAETVLGVRGRVRPLAVLEAERAAVADLAAAANRNGARTAVCETCGQSVDVGLLIVPRCPHCDSGFRSFEPKQGFFGSHTLLTGSVPALEGAVVEVGDEDLESVGGEETTAAESVGDTNLDGIGSTDDARDSGSEDEGPEHAESPDDTSESTASTPEPGSGEPGGDVFADEFELEDDATGDRASDSDEPSGAAEREPDGADGGGDPPDRRPLQAVDGVGPAYADRLWAAGVQSVEELVEADADDLADAVDVSPARAERWIGRAGDVLDED